MNSVSPLSTTIEMGMMTSPSHYPAPAVPDVPSAVSSARVSPELIREAYSPCEPSPDISLYVPATWPVAPALPEDPVQLLDTESLSPGVWRLWIAS